MTLQEYMELNNLKLGDISRRTGIKYGCVSNMVTGAKRISESAAMQIVQFTRGKVSYEEVMSRYDKKLQKKRPKWKLKNI